MYRMVVAPRYATHRTLPIASALTAGAGAADRSHTLGASMPSMNMTTLGWRNRVPEEQQSTPVVRKCGLTAGLVDQEFRIVRGLDTCWVKLKGTN